jgi:hypothetical protein
MSPEARKDDPHPHSRVWTAPRPFRVLSSALEAIGDTPCIRLNRIPQSEGVPEGVEIVAKCEFFNAGESGLSRPPSSPPPPLSPPHHLRTPATIRGSASRPTTLPSNGGRGCARCPRL